MGPVEELHSLMASQPGEGCAHVYRGHDRGAVTPRRQIWLSQHGLQHRDGCLARVCMLLIQRQLISTARNADQCRQRELMFQSKEDSCTLSTVPTGLFRGSRTVNPRIQRPTAQQKRCLAPSAGHSPGSRRCSPDVQDQPATVDCLP